MSKPESPRAGFVAVAVLVVSGFASAADNEIPSDANLSWQFKHSTDVVQVKVRAVQPANLPGLECGTIVWDVETERAFKGVLQEGDRLQVWGPSDPKTWHVGEKRLMFLQMYDGEGHDECTSNLFTRFKQVHWGCCEVHGNGADAVILFPTMTNSEESGPDFPVEARKVYKALEDLK